MCELFAMSSREPATVTFSLGILAEHGGKSAPHADGWGIAFYDDADVRMIRDTTCASRSPWVEFVAHRELHSRFVVSHIRKATDGVIALKNTQPFGRELGGRMHVFAHNGHAPDIRSGAQFQAGFYRPIGDTDSEYAFCALLERLMPTWRDEATKPTLAERIDVVSQFARDFGQVGLANFLYGDGEMIVAHGHRRKQPDGEFKAPGLFWLRRQCALRDPYGKTAGVTVTSVDQDVLLIASVPLTPEDWQPFEEGEIVAIADGRFVSIHQAEDTPTTQ